jgi:hypothetical protein
MTRAKSILTAFVIVVATLWGTAQQANAIFTSHLDQDQGATFGVLQLASTGTGTIERPLIIRSITTNTRRFG